MRQCCSCLWRHHRASPSIKSIVHITTRVAYYRVDCCATPRRMVAPRRTFSKVHVAPAFFPVERSANALEVMEGMKVDTRLRSATSAHQRQNFDRIAQASAWVTGRPFWHWHDLGMKLDGMKLCAGWPIFPVNRGVIAITPSTLLAPRTASHTQVYWLKVSCRRTGRGFTRTTQYSYPRCMT